MEGGSFVMVIVEGVGMWRGSDVIDAAFERDVIR